MGHHHQKNRKFGQDKSFDGYFGGGGQDTFDNAAAKFNEMQDEIELSIQPATGDYNQYLGARAASNDLPDMFWLTPYAQVQQFAKNGYLMDLSDQEFTKRYMTIR